MYRQVADNVEAVISYLKKLQKILKESREYIYCRLSPYKKQGEEALLRGIESFVQRKI